MKNKKSGENGDLSECFEKGEEKRKCGYWLKLITKTEKRGEKIGIRFVMTMKNQS